MHASIVSSGRTFDGISAGGLRLAPDVCTIMRGNPTLQRISFVGFFLGGLYVCYAAAVLYDSVSGIIGGLQPTRLVLVAAPNLSVRTFGVYHFLPPLVCNLAHHLYGRTGSELLLVDDAKLLWRMSTDEAASVDDSTRGATTSGTGSDKDAGECEDEPLHFLAAMRAFECRFLYSNTKRYFMVKYGTSALDDEVAEIFMNERGRTTNASRASRRVRDPNPGIDASRAEVDIAHDDQGCSLCYTLEYASSQPIEGGADSVASTRAQSANVESAADSLLRPRLETQEAQPAQVVRDMARRLRDVGWTVVAVEFPVALPVTHNRIIAMSRGPVHTWMNAAGRRVVHHLVDALLGGGVGEEVAHTPTFEKVTQPVFRRKFLSLYNVAPTV